LVPDSVKLRFFLLRLVEPEVQPPGWTPASKQLKLLVTLPVKEFSNL